MADYATKADVERIVDKAVADLTDVISSFAHQVNDRFNRLEARQDALEAKFDRLLTTIDGFVSRIDRYETEQLMRDAKFDRLLAWARKVSVKTGIPLPDL